MKRYIKGTGSFQSDVKFFTPDMDDSSMREFEETHGSYPVKEYYIASPGFYGFGGYGSDWDCHYYVLADGRCMSYSMYTGEQEFDSKADMIDKIKSVQRSILEEIDELVESGDIDEFEVDEIYDNYDFI